LSAQNNLLSVHY